MIRKFIPYIKGRLNNQLCTYTIHENTKYVHSMYVDIDNDINLGRITLWDDNSCFMEIINIETENCLLHERYEFETFDELVMIFDSFYAILSLPTEH